MKKEKQLYLRKFINNRQTDDTNNMISLVSENNHIMDEHVLQPIINLFKPMLTTWLLRVIQ